MTHKPHNVNVLTLDELESKEINNIIDLAIDLKKEQKKGKEKLLPVVGTKVEGGKKKISGYEIQNNRCVTLYEEVPIINQVVAGLPSTGAVTTTASIAVVATSSALLAKPLADLILKVIKPTIKTLMKKLQKLRGKPPKIESLSERRIAQKDRNQAIRALRTALKK